MTNKPIHAKPSLYAYYFETIKEIGLNYGYNVVLHGSMNRDLDLIAIPWVEKIGDTEEMVDKIVELIGGVLVIQNRSVDNLEGTRYGDAPHNRRQYIININRDFKWKFHGHKSVLEEYNDAQYYIDLSIIPTP